MNKALPAAMARTISASLALVIALCPAMAGAADPGAASIDAVRLDQARSLLKTMEFETLLSQLVLSTGDQTLIGELPAEGDPALLRRWLAAMNMQALNEEAARRLTGRADSAQIVEGLDYFRSPAGRADVACIRDLSQPHSSKGCNGSADLTRARQKFSDSGIADKVGTLVLELLNSDEFNGAAAKGMKSDPALNRDADDLCKRRIVLCSMMLGEMRGK